MGALKLTACMKVVSKMSEMDQESLLERLDRYTSDGVPKDRAQVMAASDTLAELIDERREFMAMLREQHPQLFVVTNAIPEDQDVDPDAPDIKRSTGRSEDEIASARADGWTIADNDLPSREAAERIVKLRTKGNSIVKPIAAWQDAEVRVVESDNPGLWSIEVRNPSIKRSPARDITDTPEFKRWFGDSKVVDADGKPLVVYHGTARSNPDFRPNRGGDIGGIYFAPSPAEASAHAAMDGEVDGGNPFVIPAYLSIQNPKVFVGGIESQEFTLDQMREWERQGFDGVIGKSSDGRVVEIAAFRPEQIKSAIGNNGQFDPESADITRSPARQIETPEFKAWSEGLPVHDSFEGRSSDRGIYKLFHMTTADFSEFKPGGLNPTDSGPAIWLSADPAATSAAFRVGNAERGFRAGARTMPVYAKVKSPLVVDDAGMLDYARATFADGSREFPQIISKSTADALKEDGYDSIIFDGPGVGWSGASVEIIVLDGKQVKSAIGNNGQFGPQNADITRSRARSPSEIFGRDIAPAAIKAYKSLSPRAEGIIDGWNVNWSIGQGKLRDSDAFAEVMAAYEPVREKLRQVYGETIPAYRGEQRGGKESEGDRFLFSWTPMREIATGFAINRRGGMPPEIPQSKVDEQIEAYRKTGIARLNGYKFVRQDPKDWEPDGPDYYHIYWRGEMQTDGDDIARALQSEKAERDEYIATLREKGRLYTADIPVDSVAFIPVGVNLTQPEFVAEYNPRKDEAQEVKFSPARNAMGLYSALAKGIEDMQTKAAPAGAWKTQIKGLVNKGQVKQDEIEWSGLEDFLDLQEGKVTKDHILEYLRNNGVQVEEVKLADKTDVDSGFYTEESPDEDGVWLVYNSDDEILESFDSESEADDFVRDRNSDVAGGTKYGKYTLPGGENYREVLLTLPTNPAMKNSMSPNVERVISELPQGVVEGLPEDAIEPFAESMAERFGVSKKDMLDGIRFIRGERSEPIVRQDYHSSHWDQPNVIAHIRVNDRTDADGRRVLLVEEIQSDWGQEGKKKGVIKSYKPDDVQPISAAEAGKMTVADEELFWHFKTPDNIFSIPKSKYAGREAARDYIIREKKINSGGVPDAPFIGKTDGWLNLALKRVIAMAVDGGYDAVAFVNGDQSADRYDLSKRVAKVTYNINKNSISAYADDRPGAQSIFTRAASEDELPDIIGKELADRLINAEPNPNGLKILRGLDLKVGGEGMRAFYDKIVPNAVKALLKKTGGGQLEMVEMVRPNASRRDEILAEIEAEEGRPRARTSRLEQPGFTITDTMREKVSTEGLPLFSRKRDMTDTPEFKAWSGGAPLVELGDDHDFRSGQPVVVEALHGTTNADLTEFKRERANMGSDMGAGFYASNSPDDVATNYANNEGADLTQRIELMAERLAANEFDDDMDAARKEAKRRLTQESPNTLKLYVSFKNPAVLGGKGETYFDYNEEYNEETDEYGEPTGRLVDFVNALDEVGDGLDISMRDLEQTKTKLLEAAEGEGLKFSELAEIVKSNAYADDVNTGDSANSEVLRQALAGMGFDGVIDTTVYEKFGPRMIEGVKTEGMKGMTKDTVHFIAFNPTQLKSATGNRGTFDPADSDITRSPARQTDTPEFKAWFGDSKVVDADGKPLVVYHGTKRDFTAFDTERGSELGSHFGTQQQAESVLNFWRAKKKTDGIQVMPAYLSIKNPLRLTDVGYFGAAGVNPQLVQLGILKEAAKSSAEAKAAIEAAGYDGVVYTNTREGSGDSYIAFRPEQIKSAIGNRGTFDPNDAEIARSPGRTATGAAWDSPSASKWDDVVYKLQDKQVDLKRVTDAIQEAGGAIADDLNVYLQEELYHGRAAKRTEDFVNMELNPLVEQLAKDGLQLEDLEEFLHARHAKEANEVIAQRNPGVQDLQDGGSGMKTADAMNYMASLPADLRQKLEAAAAKVDDILKKTRELYVDYELESRDTVDAWGKMFQHYIPLMREDKDGNGSPGLGQGFSIKGKEVKGRTGSTRKVVDILANIALQRERAIVRGEKNRVSQALVGLASSNPNEGFWIVDEVPTERVFNEKTGLVEDRVDPLYKSRPNAIIAKIKGPDGKVKEHAILFNEEDERAMRMAAALKNLDADKLEGLMGVSAMISRYFAASVTQWNPLFGPVNMIRDVQAVALNLSSTPIKGEERRVLRNVMPALAGVYKDLRAARKGKTTNTQWAKLWEEFQDVGGQTGYRDLFRNSEERANAIKKVLDPDAWADTKLGRIFTAGGALKVPLAQARRAAAWIFDWLSDYNDALENGVRLAVYKAGLDRGLSKEQAASIAKNASTNFNRKGQIGQQAGALYAFFNAAVQGTARIGDTLFDMEPGKPKTMRLSSTGKKIVGGGVLLGAIQALMLAAAGYDDEDPPQFARERSLIIPIGDKKYVSIPMPLGFNVIPNIGRIATEFALGGFKDPHERAVQLISLFSETFNPIGSAGLSMQTLAPTALDPLVALTENKDWTGKPIARESSNPAIPGHALAKDTATTWSKAISEGINTLSGGNKYVAGVFSPTPDQIDYLLGWATGGVGREISKLDQTVTAAVYGEELPPYKIPLVGRFYGNARSQASEGSAFYANTQDLNKLETEIKGLEKDGKRAEANELRRSRSEAYLITAANQAERQVQRLRQQKRELIKNDAPREQVQAVEAQITTVMARLNRAMEALEEKQK